MLFDEWAENKLSCHRCVVCACVYKASQEMVTLTFFNMLHNMSNMGYKKWQLHAGPGITAFFHIACMGQGCRRIKSNT